MICWPVYMWAPMYDDDDRVYRPGDRIEWNVTLTDGEVAGWPWEVLVDTTLEIAAPPAGHRGSLGITPQLSACWLGEEPIGRVRPIRAGLTADLFNPPFATTLTGTVRRIRLVSRRLSVDPEGVMMPTGPWRLDDLSETPARVEPPGPDAEHDPWPDGLLFDVEVEDCALHWR